MGRYNFWDYFNYYQPAQPKKVKGGIKAQSKRGAFTHNWWSIELEENILACASSNRVQRGRRYARSGQVKSLEIRPGLVEAEVQGTSSEAYQCVIHMSEYTLEGKKICFDILKSHPVFTIELMSRKLHDELPVIFEEKDLSLIPGIEEDDHIDIHCNCLDYAVPCKHLVAVIYLFLEAFDQDPFLLFKIRGIEKDELLENISCEGEMSGGQKNSESVSEPLPDNADEFWKKLPPELFESFHVSELHTHAVLPRLLGNIPFWRSKTDFQSYMEELYKKASEKTLSNMTL